MARTNTATPATIDREAQIAELTAKILGAKAAPSGATLGQRVAGFFGNVVADSGNSVAEVAAGFSAAGRNFVVAKELAEQRQARRTAERIYAAMNQ